MPLKSGLALLGPLIASVCKAKTLLLSVLMPARKEPSVAVCDSQALVMVRGVPCRVQGSNVSAAVSVACCPGRGMLCWPVCDGQFPLRLRFARRIRTICPFGGGGRGSNAVSSVGGRASQRWWEGPRGLICGTSWLSFRRYSGVWLIPWGWQGRAHGMQSSFYSELLGLKIDLVLLGGRS